MVKGPWVDATEVVRRALAGTGVDVVGSSGVDTYDARAPEGLRSTALFPRARGVVVAASAGPALWRRFRQAAAERPDRWRRPHPYDDFVAEILGEADNALGAAGVAFRRFDAAFAAPVRLSFAALGELAGLGSPGPFGLLIHAQHGPWWALRGAWLVDADVDASPAAPTPCAGCAAPCVGGSGGPGGLALATPEVRGRCVVGQESRYDDDQIAYHYAGTRPRW
ncbi:MAG TPA: hypothetical protein VKU41_16760 [Polyangiaceae bacterium]|nr:hypothetical protein [Polyangiaceae bacterium]